MGKCAIKNCHEFVMTNHNYCDFHYNVATQNVANTPDGSPFKPVPIPNSGSVPYNVMPPKTTLQSPFEVAPPPAPSYDHLKYDYMNYKPKRRQVIKDLTNEKEDTTGEILNLEKYEEYQAIADKHDTKAKRYNKDKLALNLVTWEWVKWLAELLQAGALKYSPKNPTEENWKKSLNTSDHSYFVYDRRESAKRHLMQYDSGELIDPDTKSPHMVMVAWNCLVIAWYDFYKESK